MQDALLKVVFETSLKVKGCRDCRREVIWRVTPNGRNVAIDAHAIPRRADQDPETFVRYDYFDRDDIHRNTCRRPRPAPQPDRKFAAAGDR